jgi:hypothetical protein
MNIIATSTPIRKLVIKPIRLEALAEQERKIAPRRRGRPCLGEKAMTNAERKRRHRAKSNHEGKL